MQIDMNKLHGGRPVQYYVDELEIAFNMIMRGQSWKKPFQTKEELKEWCKYEQPYYKKHIPGVYNYFLKRTNLK